MMTNHKIDKDRKGGDKMTIWIRADMKIQARLPKEDWDRLLQTIFETQKENQLTVSIMSVSEIEQKDDPIGLKVGNGENVLVG